MSDNKKMRIVVFSDSHGGFRLVKKIFEQNENADLYIFLGDGERDIEHIKTLYPDKYVISVKGNCDYDEDIPKEIVYTLPDSRKIFACHGNRYSVNSSIDRLFYRGKEIGASVVLFGHTHCRYLSYDEGMYMLNPGSAAQPRDGFAPSYAFIDLMEDGMFCAHVDIK